MSILQYNNGNLSYITKTNGDLSIPIVFIHGFALDCREWKYQVEWCNRNNFSYIIYDMRGFGKSSVPTKEYSHVEDLYALISKVCFEKIIVCGHSFGGEVALDFTLKYPQKVTGLLLIAPSSKDVRPVENESNDFFAELKHLAKSSSQRFVKDRIIGHESVQALKNNFPVFELLKEVVDDYSLWHFLNQDRVINISNNINEIDKIECPTKILVGSKDSKLNVSVSYEISKRIKGSELCVVKDFGHFLNLECPDIVNENIEALTNQLKKLSINPAVM